MSEGSVKHLADANSLKWILGLTLAIEMLCIVLRFGFSLSSTASTASTIGVLTFGLRIHHGYIGLLLSPVGFMLSKRTFDYGWFAYVAGISLVVSDLIHHFIVLWLVTGSPQFDLMYPA